MSGYLQCELLPSCSYVTLYLFLNPQLFDPFHFFAHNFIDDAAQLYKIRKELTDRIPNEAEYPRRHILSTSPSRARCQHFLLPSV